MTTLNLCVFFALLLFLFPSLTRFDGSGANNNYDAGSCIDGRLTSAWNWCSKVGPQLEWNGMGWNGMEFVWIMPLKIIYRGYFVLCLGSITTRLTVSLTLCFVISSCVFVCYSWRKNYFTISSCVAASPALTET